MRSQHKRLKSVTYQYKSKVRPQNQPEVSERQWNNNKIDEITMTIDEITMKINEITIHIDEITIKINEITITIDQKG